MKSIIHSICIFFTFNLYAVTNDEIEAGKPVEEFRNYQDSERQDVVERHYRLMRQNQSFEFVEKMEQKYLPFDHAKMTIWEAFEALEGYVDSSDPDSSLPNLEHMLQTAEAIRQQGYPDWFQLVGLLHDMGKIQYLWGQGEDGQEGTASGDQWALGGDTWVVGCQIPASVVFPHFNHLNQDALNPQYNTKLGIYQSCCGFDNLKFAWGHDEYMYQMLKHNQVKIPEIGLKVIRYHSCYPWHQHNEYKHFMVDEDKETLEWVLKFNQFDLYTKSDERPDLDKLKPYYEKIIAKYLPENLDW